MLKSVSSLLITLCVAISVTATIGAQQQPQPAQPQPAQPLFQHPTSDWLTWSLMDAAEDSIDLSGYQNGNTFVVLFSAADSKSCKLMNAIAAHVRSNPNLAGKVLAVCIDDNGHKALKQYIRQEEWTKRVAAWEATQEAAATAAQAANQEFTRPQMPDFLKVILEELEDETDLETLMDHYFPFNTACRDEAMWDWLSERMDAPAKAPRILKFNANGVELAEWSTRPAALGG